MSKKQELMDRFAEAALNALISKMPSYDATGKYGMKIPQEDIDMIKKELPITAYNYAKEMMIAREESKEFLRENEKTNSNFGS